VQCIIYIDGIINGRDLFLVVLDKSWGGGGLGIVADVNNLALGEDGSCDRTRRAVPWRRCALMEHRN
jgi:hypothetical protein